MPLTSTPAVRQRPALIEYPRRRPPVDYTSISLAIAMALACGVEMALVAARTDLRAAHRITWETRSARVPAAGP